MLEPSVEVDDVVVSPDVEPEASELEVVRPPSSEVDPGIGSVVVVDGRPLVSAPEVSAGPVSEPDPPTPLASNVQASALPTRTTSGRARRTTGAC